MMMSSSLNNNNNAVFAKLLILLWRFFVVVTAVRGEQNNNAAASYGVDCSFAIHSRTEFKCNNDVLGDKKSFYEHFVEGCKEHLASNGKGAERCDLMEDYQISMMLRQPQSMINYTKTGYAKIRAPENVMNLLQNYWNNQEDTRFSKPEVHTNGDSISNYWLSPTYMVDVFDDAAKITTGSSQSLSDMIWDFTKETMEEWTGMILRPSSLYGIRVYTDGAVLRPHVDRLPLVASAIINVDQDVDEPWPLEVYNRQGKAVNITLQPGEMILYESHSIIHGRPFPLKGRHYANVFVHFEPLGRTRSVQEQQDDDDDENSPSCTENEGDDEYLSLPPYVIPGSPEVDHWRSRNPNGWNRQRLEQDIVVAQQMQGGDNDGMILNHEYVVLPGHVAAIKSDIGKLAELYVNDAESYYLTLGDQNGWQPIHEASRNGNFDVVKLLIAFGADMNARTNGGSTPLNLAMTHIPPAGEQEGNHNHPVIKYFQSLGAENAGRGV